MSTDRSTEMTFGGEGTGAGKARGAGAETAEGWVVASALGAEIETGARLLVRYSPPTASSANAETNTPRFTERFQSTTVPLVDHERSSPCGA